MITISKLINENLSKWWIGRIHYDSLEFIGMRAGIASKNHSEVGHLPNHCRHFFLRHLSVGNHVNMAIIIVRNTDGHRGFHAGCVWFCWGFWNVWDGRCVWKTRRHESELPGLWVHAHVLLARWDSDMRHRNDDLTGEETDEFSGWELLRNAWHEEVWDPPEIHVETKGVVMMLFLPVPCTLGVVKHLQIWCTRSSMPMWHARVQAHPWEKATGLRLRLGAGLWMILADFSWCLMIADDFWRFLPHVFTIFYQRV